ncbi:MAG TPA: hypothetical protein VFV07_05495 [Rhizomicrobium sp.]|nr:hypothetical protein [Rhizomicrobium sp.]
MPHASSSRERLGILLDLAAQGAAGRTALLDELAGLLVDWPADYVQAMRGPFEALFEKTAREAAPEVRAALAERLAEHDELPVALLNEFFLDASPASRVHILRRNAVLDEPDGAPPHKADSRALVAAARRTVNGAFLDVFAHALSLPPALAHAIFADAEAMAVACRGAGIDRAAYSTIALLTGSGLADFENIPVSAAARLVAFWQARS